MIAGIVLAAGTSSRFGSTKLLEQIGEDPLVVLPVRAALTAGLDPVVVVVGHDAAAVQRALPPLVTVVQNRAHMAGMSTSLVAGIDALPDPCEAAVILLGDLPEVDARHVEAVVDAYRGSDAVAVRPNYGGVPGHPVLISKALFDEVRKVTGDRGARDVLDGCERVLELDLAMAVPMDIDTPEDLHEARSKLEGRTST